MIPAEIVVIVLFGWLTFHVVRWALRAHSMREERDKLIGENMGLREQIAILEDEKRDLARQLATAVRPAQSSHRPSH